MLIEEAIADCGVQPLLEDLRRPLLFRFSFLSPSLYLWLYRRYTGAQFNLSSRSLESQSVILTCRYSTSNLELFYASGDGKAFPHKRKI